jgi:pimeloyl-ACP methyl ester carboxylesterase
MYRPPSQVKKNKSRPKKNRSDESPPEWFTEAISVEPERRDVLVSGCRIHYLVWGSGSRPVLMLLHGGAAHAHWWGFLAPMFADRFTVVAPHLRGMGDSDHCPAYEPVDFAEDVIAVCDDMGTPEKVFIVGHSFGGYITLKTALVYPDRVQGIVLVDSAVRRANDPRRYDPTQGPLAGKKSIYPDPDTAFKRFRLVPAQPVRNRYLYDFIARHSIRQEDAGWTWKFDDRFFQNLNIEYLTDQVSLLQCRKAVIYGEFSTLCTSDVVEFMRDQFGEDAPFVRIDGAHHHVMLDEPLAFYHALDGVLRQWIEEKPE